MMQDDDFDDGIAMPDDDLADDPAMSEGAHGLDHEVDLDAPEEEGGRASVAAPRARKSSEPAASVPAPKPAKKASPAKKAAPAGSKAVVKKAGTIHVRRLAKPAKKAAKPAKKAVKKVAKKAVKKVAKKAAKKAGKKVAGKKKKAGKKRVVPALPYRR